MGTLVNKIMSRSGQRIAEWFESEGTPIQVEAIRPGYMQDGRLFCEPGTVYHGFKLPEEEEGEGAWYEIITMVCDPLSPFHGMDEDFFNDYFTERE